VRADLLAIAAQNVERRLNAMPSFLALFAKYAVLLWKIASMRLLGSSPGGQALTSVYTTAFIATNPLKAPHLL
jgi:hypothetical protein